MNDPVAQGMSKRKLILAVAGVVLVLGSAAGYGLSAVSHQSTAGATRSFTLPCSFSRFRQLMVRKQPTREIVAHGGMKLIDETVQDLKVDHSLDDRPLLNAIRGKSKIQLDAVRTLTVELKDPHLENEQLTLNQIVDIDADRLQVRSTSVGEQQSIKAYETTLDAAPVGDQTEIVLTVEMTIEIQVPRAFTGTADHRIAAAAEKALADQQSGITQFVIDHADESLIMPEFFPGQ